MTDPSLSYSDRSSFGDLLAWWSWPSGPHRTSLLICHAVALLTFVVSTITGDLSQVDRLWSILPAVYAWTCVVDARTTLAACLATAWSVRLTYNFYRRGGYGSWPRPWRGDEDYRWGTLRSGSLGGRWWTLLTNGWIMTIFNFVFISFFQNYLLLYIASPSLVAWSMATVATPPSLNIVDAIASVLFVVSLIGETVADNQQRAFQKGKEAWRLRNSRRTDDAGLADAGDASSSVERQYEDGFCQSGLFAIVRKPAYAFEQLIWISYYLFSVAAVTDGHSDPGGGRRRYYYWNWSGGGWILLCLLFQGSGWLTEKISMSKYSAYCTYRKSVPLYVPRISSLRRLIVGVAVEDREKDE